MLTFSYFWSTLIYILKSYQNYRLNIGLFLANVKTHYQSLQSSLLHNFKCQTVNCVDFCFPEHLAFNHVFAAER